MEMETKVKIAIQNLSDLAYRYARSAREQADALQALQILEGIIRGQESCSGLPDE